MSKRKTTESSVLFDAPGPRTRRLFAIGNVVALALIAAGLVWVISVLADKDQFTPEKWRPFVESNI